MSLSMKWAKSPDDGRWHRMTSDSGYGGQWSTTSAACRLVQMAFVPDEERVATPPDGEDACAACQKIATAE